MAKLSEKDSNMTSYWGDQITATPNQLIELIGKPQWGYNDGTDKTNMDWVCETEGGKVFTIYDWKEYRPLNMDSYYGFHIGAHSKEISNQAWMELKTMFITQKIQ